MFFIGLRELGLVFVRCCVFSVVVVVSLAVEMLAGLVSEIPVIYHVKR